MRNSTAIVIRDTWSLYHEVYLYQLCVAYLNCNRHRTKYFQCSSTMSEGASNSKFNTVEWQHLSRNVSATGQPGMTRYTKIFSLLRKLSINTFQINFGIPFLHCFGVRRYENQRDVQQHSERICPENVGFNYNARPKHTVSPEIGDLAYMNRTFCHGYAYPSRRFIKILIM